jgi:hypothetical protein
MNINIIQALEEALMISNTFKAQMDSNENPIDIKLNSIPPLKVSDDTRLIIIGQDATVKNPLIRKYINNTLNLDKSGGSQRNYIEKGFY